MPDMTPFDQESYGIGYTRAEEDISANGIGFAERFAVNLAKHEKNNWLVVGYVTCVEAWKEGVRL